MAYFRGPNIVTSGLTLYLDAGNEKSFRGEPTTNLLLYSEEFDNGYWGKINVSITSGATISPDGTLSADLWTNSNATNHQFYRAHNSSSVVRTLSVYVKKTMYRGCYLGAYSNNFAVYYDLDTTSVCKINSPITGVTGSIQYISDGWFRISASFPSIAVEIHIGFLDSAYTSTSTSPWAVSTVIGTSGYFWGSQLEANSYVTPYIKSTSVNGTRGSTVATGGGLIDLSRNSNNGSLSGVTYSSSSSNMGSLVFNGINNYIATTYGKDINPYLTPISFNLWIKIDSISASPQMIISTGQSRGNGNFSMRMYIAIYSGFWDWGIQGTSWTLGNVVANTNWNFISIVLGTDAKFYLNGVLLYNRSTNNTFVLNDNFWLGTHDVAGDYPCNGHMGSFQLYNRYLTQSEILQNYNATKSRFI